MQGLALNSGRGDDMIRVALHYDKSDKKPATGIEPFAKYTYVPNNSDEDGFISMTHPPVIKANHVTFAIFPQHPLIGDIKRDISKPRLRPP